MNSFWRRAAAGSLPRLSRSLSLLLCLLGFSPSAPAQDYPNRPVRLITDSAPGSAIDVPVPIIAEDLSRIWGSRLW